MSTLYFLRQPFADDPKDTWRLASSKAFDLTPEANRMAVIPEASLAAAQQEIARLRAALEKLLANGTAYYSAFEADFGFDIEEWAAEAREALK